MLLHVLYFLKQIDAELAARFICEELNKNVIVGLGKVFFRTSDYVSGRTQLRILTWVNCYNTQFNIREVGAYGYMVRN